MNEMMDSLKSWKGSQFVSDSLLDAGFKSHVTYREQIVEFCVSAGCRSDLAEYWNEVAKEYILSGGLHADGDRSYFAPGTYRSGYLDKLEREFKNSGKFPRPPTRHPCLYKFLETIEFFNNDIYFEIRETVELSKSDECSSCDRFLDLWDGSLIGVSKIFSELALDLGFQPDVPKGSYKYLSDTGFSKKAHSKLIFFAGFDAGGRCGRLTNHLPFEFWIRHEDRPDDNLFLSDFRYVVPGVEQYANFSSARSAIVGTSALLTTLDIFSRSF
jgi:hypothetical protein